MSGLNRIKPAHMSIKVKSLGVTGSKRLPGKGEVFWQDYIGLGSHSRTAADLVGGTNTQRFYISQRTFPSARALVMSRNDT